MTQREEMNEAQVNPAETVVAESVPAAAETSVTPVVPEEQTIPKSRFDEVYRHRREAERERDYWREQAMQAKPKEPEPLVLPTPEQHGFDDAKYQSALVEYNRGIAKATAISAYQAEKARDQQQQKAQSFRQLETEFEAKNPQYREKVYNSGLPISQATAELIADSPDGPAVALYLADNLELAQQIYDLPPVQAARELGRIEARLAQKVTPKPALTNAPPPPPTIDAGEPAISVDPGGPGGDQLSMADWLKRRNKQVHKKR
jgi:hypothetical protein